MNYEYRLRMKVKMMLLTQLSSPERLVSYETIPPLSNSDHLGLHVMISGQTNQTIAKNAYHRQIWHYTHADFDMASELLCNLDLDAILDIIK